MNELAARPCSRTALVTRRSSECDAGELALGRAHRVWWKLVEAPWAYTYKLQANPKNSANALSAFGGVLSTSGVTKIDDYTVAFHLDGPNGNFPYLTSSENNNLIILPDGYL